MMGSMEKMGREMLAAPMTGDPDHDFAAMMIPHHQGAAAYCRRQRRARTDPECSLSTRLPYGPGSMCRGYSLRQVRIGQCQHRVGGRGVTHELPNVGCRVALLVQGGSGPGACGSVLIPCKPPQTLSQLLPRGGHAGLLQNE